MVPILFFINHATDWFGLLRWWMDMPVASFFVSSCGFTIRGGKGAEDNMWSLTCSLALYPYRCIFPSRGVMRETLHDHQTHLQPQLLPTTPSSSLLIYLCRLTTWLRLPLKPPCFLWLSWRADGGLGVKTAEQQPDQGTECEGRRGRAPDLSDWWRPAREMYSLPLLYRNPSPYEY